MGGPTLGPVIKAPKSTSKDGYAATVKARWNGNKLTCKTAANGKCTITFPQMGKNKIKVSATKAGYAPDETKLNVD